MADGDRIAPRVVASIAAAALLICSGLVHGRWTGRWGDSGVLDAAVARLDRVPDVIGDWHGEPLEIDQRQLEQAEIDGYISRRFEDRRGHAVTVLLVCGRPGPISVHTPDVCYRGAGYEPTATPARTSIERDSSPPAAEFLTARFDRRAATMPQSLHILWSWNAEGRWEAPDHPRLRFAPSPFLYKLYVIREAAPRVELDDIAIRDSFLRQFLPALDNTLFPVKADVEIASTPPG